MDTTEKVVSCPDHAASIISQHAIVDKSIISLDVSGFVILDVTP